MKKLVSKEVINTILVILLAYLYTHYVAPYINRFFGNPFVSWGGVLAVIGIWGNLAKMVLIRSVFITDSYKKENYFSYTQMISYQQNQEMAKLKI